MNRIFHDTVESACFGRDSFCRLSVVLDGYMWTFR